MLGIAYTALILLSQITIMLALQHSIVHVSRFIQGRAKLGLRASSSSSAASSGSLAERVYGDLTTACGVTSNTCLLLCVSGGMDSMAMLHLAGEIKQKYEPNLIVEVLNFNHKLRPEAAEKETELVESWCQHYNFPFHCVERDDEEAFGEKGVQEAAREWRQETTKTLLGIYRKRNEKSDMIAQITGRSGGPDGESQPAAAVAVTAHHMDDQVETSLMKIIRGVHISRMYAMLPRSECGNFIKPLLGVGKEELYQYMDVNDFPWLEDESNQSRKYKRNAVRLDVVPAMASLAGGKEALHRRFESMSQQSRELRGWLEAEARSFLMEHAMVSSAPGREDTYFYTEAFSQLPSPVQYEVVHFLISQATGVSVDFEKCKAVTALAVEPVKDGVASRAINLQGMWRGTKIGCIFRVENAEQADKGVEMQLTAFMEGRVEISHPAALRLQVTSGKEGLAPALGTTRTMSLVGLEEEKLELRYPLPEDHFRGGKLTEYLRSRKVPLHQRDRVLLLASKGSRVVLGLFMPSGSKEGKSKGEGEGEAVVVAEEHQGGEGEVLTVEIIE